MMNYFSNRKKWMAYLILLTFVFTCIVPTNIVGGNSEAWADTNEFTVQYYAELETLNHNGDDLSIIDTSNGNWIPKNGSGYPSLIKLDVSSDKTLAKNLPKQMQIFSNKTYNAEQYPSLAYFDQVSKAGGNYTLKAIYVLKAGKEIPPEDADFVPGDWYSYTETDIPNLSFSNTGTNNGGNVISLDNNAVIRLVYAPVTAMVDQPADFYDYDITNGGFTLNGVTHNTSEQETLEATLTPGEDFIYADTSYKGINSSSNYSGTLSKLAFGNTNTDTGLQNEAYSGHTMNKYNHNNAHLTEESAKSPKSWDYGCTFGLVKGLNSNGTLNYNVSAPKLFNETLNPNEVVQGKTEVIGWNLNFNRVGDTYTLKSVNNSGQYDQFNNPSTGAKTYYSIWTNNFWPMDNSSTWGTDGHDIKFGSKESFENYWYEVDGTNSTTTEGLRNFNGAGVDTTNDTTFPISDDGLDHNSYFGMHYTVDFTLADDDSNGKIDYVGPLNYYFFGDDDMWVFLSKKGGTDENPTYSNAKLVCDIGGVHSSVGQYVDLWDYVDSDKAIGQKTSAGDYTLHFFYTERGASGSTCYMQFTLPSVRTATPTQEYGSLKISKAVEGIETNETFTFNVELDDNTSVANIYDYTIYEANGAQVSEGKIYNKNGYEKTIVLQDGQYALITVPEGTTYKVTEVEKAAYTSTVTPSNEGAISRDVTANVAFTNTYKTGDISVEKVWADDNNRDGKRADVTVELQKLEGEGENAVWVFADIPFMNGDKADVQKAEQLLTTSSSMTYTWTNVPLYDVNGKEIKYRVVEKTPLSGYEVSYKLKSQTETSKEPVEIGKELTTADERTVIITNTHIPGKTSVSGSKTWIDGNNMDGTRPDSITINLLADGEKIDSKTVTAADKWTFIFENLNEKKNGKDIVYTVMEEPVSGYESEYDDEKKLDITNTLLQKYVTVEGTKIWKDGNDNHNSETITLELFRDGRSIATTTTAYDWSYSFGELPKYALEDANLAVDEKADGHVFEYQVREQDVPAGYVPDYNVKVNANGDYYITITNNVRDDKSPTSISGEKIWKDGEGKAVEIELFGNGQYIATTTTAYDYDLKAWTYKFDELPKYKDGNWINYTVKEVPVDGYISTVIPTEDGFDIVNTSYVENQGQIAVGKVVTTEDGATPPSADTEFEFNLRIKAELDMTEFDKAVAKEKDALWAVHEKAKEKRDEAYIALNGSNVEGKEVEGAVNAFKASAYLTTESQYKFIMVDDSQNPIFAAKTSPSAYVYNVVGENAGRLDITDENKSILDEAVESVLEAIKDLANSFSSLYNAPSFLDALMGCEVESTSPSALAFGITETNKLLQAHGAYNAAEKLVKDTHVAWEAYDVTTPTAIKVFWNHDGEEEILNLDTDSNLLKDDYYWLNFNLKNGEVNSFRVEATTGAAISFKLSETNSHGADATNIIVTENGKEVETISGLFVAERGLTTESAYGFTFNNIYKPEGGNGGGGSTTISRSVEKVWNDNNNPDRPTSITVQLLRNGEVMETVTLSAANGWDYNWPELDAGYTWSVKEVNVAEGYTASVTRTGDTFIITNSMTTTPTDPDETIPDENVPTGSVEPGEPLDELDEPEIPLGDAPATGDTNNAAPFMALLLAAIAGLVITRRKFN